MRVRSRVATLYNASQELVQIFLPSFYCSPLAGVPSIQKEAFQTIICYQIHHGEKERTEGISIEMEFRKGKRNKNTRTSKLQKASGIPLSSHLPLPTCSPVFSLCDIMNYRIRQSNMAISYPRLLMRRD